MRPLPMPNYHLYGPKTIDNCPGLRFNLLHDLVHADVRAGQHSHRMFAKPVLGPFRPRLVARKVPLFDDFNLEALGTQQLMSHGQPRNTGADNNDLGFVRRGWNQLLL